MATLLIGATGGIGEALARGWPAAFPDEQGALWLSGRNEEKLGALASELNATTLKADVGYESHIKGLFEGLDTPLDTLGGVANGPVAFESRGFVTYWGESIK